MLDKNIDHGNNMETMTGLVGRIFCTVGANVYLLNEIKNG